ncbi:hypothetical protein BGZ83_007006 [Gryganskiella cystojenkinii]|nr:hypothetical protein BGZ83_007006 [Gryganskiella cystojenkinii]
MASAPASTSNTTAARGAHRSRASSAFIFPETADYHSSSTSSPRLQILSGTGSPCGDGKELLSDEYSEIEYSDFEGEDDMMFDDENPQHHHHHVQQYSPQHHLHLQQQQQQQQQGRSFRIAGKGDYPSHLPSVPSSMSSPLPSSPEQEQVEEALRASLSTLLATGPRPRFKQRRPRKIYTVDARSSRSSPLIPASPTHVYYSATGSPHLRPSSNPDSILGDLSPHYFQGAITPISRGDYDSASSDSEACRQQKKKGYRRGILSTGSSPYSRSSPPDHYYEIESTTLNSDDPPFSGSTTPLLSPHHYQATATPTMTLPPPDPVANKVLQGPSSLLATRYVSWSVKAQSILDHAAKDREHRQKTQGGVPETVPEEHSPCSSPASSTHTSPTSSGASTPSRLRRKRCTIPEPHQGFFSRALDQRSLASHVSVSRVGMAGTMYPPLQVGLRPSGLIRGSSPLRPTTATGSSAAQGSPTATTRQYSFNNTISGGNGGQTVLGSRNDNMLDNDQVRQSLEERHRRRTSSSAALGGGGGGVDDKENKRWYGQEIGLNLWQTTLGAAGLLGPAFGSGMVRKVHNNGIQLHPKELCNTGSSSSRTIT